MDNQRLLIFANTPIGRKIFGVPDRKRIIKITDGSVHFLTGCLSKKTGWPVICSQASPAGRSVKKIKLLLKIFPDIADLAFIGAYHPAIWLMADTGWCSPSATGAMYNQWTNPEKAYSSNDDYATVAAYSNVSDYRQSYEAFDFGIVPGATIEGMEVSHEWFYDINLGIHYASIYLVSGAGYHQQIMPIYTYESVQTVGGPEDLWDFYDPVDTDFSNANFHTFPVVNSQFRKICNFSLDHIQVKIYFSAGPAAFKGAYGFVF